MSAELKFHPDFGTPSESRQDVLQAADDTYFYYSLTTLRVLSSFFSGLPGATSPITVSTTTSPIHLEHAPNEALAFCLTAIDRLIRPGPIPKLYRDLLPDILKLCDVYDLPCVPLFIYRQRHLLGFDEKPPVKTAACPDVDVDILPDPPKSPANDFVDDPFLDFGLAVLANDEDAAIRASVRCAFGDITKLPQWIRDLLVRWAPMYLIRLHELLSSQLRCKNEILQQTHGGSGGVWAKFLRSFGYCGEHDCPVYEDYGPGREDVGEEAAKHLSLTRWTAADILDPRHLAQRSIPGLPCAECEWNVKEAVRGAIEDSLTALRTSI